MLLVKLIVLLLLGFVIVSLFSGLYFLIKDRGQTNRTVNALSVRIGLSVLAIVVVLIAGLLGMLETNPNPALVPTAAVISEGASAGSGESGVDAAAGNATRNNSVGK